jgi:hypothetical protein
MNGLSRNHLIALRVIILSTYVYKMKMASDKYLEAIVFIGADRSIELYTF